MRERRWDPCVVHRDEDVDQFINTYLARGDRELLIVTGSGFDPRSCAVVGRFDTSGASAQAILIREERPNPSIDQAARAEANASRLLDVLPGGRVVPIEVFGPDNAVVGGRNVVRCLRGQDLGGITDVIVDISALSAGMSFPIVRYFVEQTVHGDGAFNLHVFVVHDPHVDAGIHSIASDWPMYVHGFKGRATLSSMAGAAKLWLPQLSARRKVALERLYGFVRPHDTCPILPFPAADPRIGDRLAEMYLTEFEDVWEVDARNIIYADEGDPLDLYRRILRLDDLRKPVFEHAGGSILFLSPLGSKLMALGALMAALERNLPVVYLESIGYELDAGVPEEVKEPSLVHLWLEGDVYPRPRPPLQTQEGSDQ